MPFLGMQFSCEDRDASEYAEHFAVYIYRTTTTGDETRVFYYPGYRHNWDQQVSKISVNGNTDLLANDYERVHYYCDVIF